MYRTYSGYCPHTKEENEIDINYAEVVISKSHKRHFKHMGFECNTNTDEDNGCPYANKNQCPLYEKSPVTIEM